MKVNNETRKIIFGKMPWMRDLLPANTDTFRVELIDLDLLSLRTAGKYYRPGHHWEWRPEDKILLLNNEGREIGQVGWKEESRPAVKWILKWPFLINTTRLQEEVFEESVEQALARIGVLAESVRNILHIKPPSHMPHLVLHKMPRKFGNLSQWIKHKTAEQIADLNTVLMEAEVT